MSKDLFINQLINELKMFPVKDEFKRQLRVADFSTPENKKNFILSVYKEIRKQKLIVFHDFPPTDSMVIAQLFFNTLAVQEYYFHSNHEFRPNYLSLIQIVTFLIVIGGPALYFLCMPFAKEKIKSLNQHQADFADEFKIADLKSELDAQRLMFIISEWHIKASRLENMLLQILACNNPAPKTAILTKFWQEAATDFKVIADIILDSSKRNFFHRLPAYLAFWGTNLILFYQISIYGYGFNSLCWASAGIFIYLGMNQFNENKEDQYSIKLARLDIREITDLIERNCVTLEVKSTAKPKLKSDKKLVINTRKKPRRRTCDINSALAKLYLTVSQLPGLFSWLVFSSREKNRQLALAEQRFQELNQEESLTDSSEESTLQSSSSRSNPAKVGKGKTQSSNKPKNKIPFGDNRYLPLAVPKQSPSCKTKLANVETGTEEKKPLESTVIPPTTATLSISRIERLKIKRLEQALGDARQDLENAQYELNTMGNELENAKQRLADKDQTLGKTISELQETKETLNWTFFRWQQSSWIARAQAFQLRLFQSIPGIKLYYYPDPIQPSHSPEIYSP